MATRTKRLNRDDALASILDGDQSDLSDCSTDEDMDEYLPDDGDNADDEISDTSYSGDEASKDDEIDPSTEHATTEEEHAFRWRKRDLSRTVVRFCNQHEDIPDEIIPLLYFKQFWLDELTDLVAEQTNLYSVQKTGHSVNTNKNEVEQLIGMNMRMGIVQLPSYTLYWSTQMRYPAIADVMPLKRFEKLRRFVHFVDNTTYDQEEGDKLFKVKPTIEAVRKQCLKVIPEESHSVDEQIIPAKTRYSRIRQYNPKKPVKWGFKNMVRAGSSGIMYDFYIYSGKGSSTDIPEDAKHLEKCAQAVAKVCLTLPPHANHKLFVDNWFTTLNLLLYLKDLGIMSCGTIRANRLRGFPLQTSKELTKSGRGSIDYRSDADSGIIVAKWLDNKPVHIVSNFVGVEPMGTVERWCQKSKARKKIQCPQMILSYNSGMGGVDLADMLIALYRIKVKTRRWYQKIFWHCVDIAKVNAWLLYRRHSDQNGIPKRQQLTLLKFSTAIAEGLISANKVQPQATPGRAGRPMKRKSCDVETPAKCGKKPTVPMPNEVARFDQLGHWPEHQSNRSRCRNCKSGYSQVFCSKCKVCLCLRNGSNCFKDFHMK